MRNYPLLALRVESCDCFECFYSEQPCALDCTDKKCAGCREMEAEREEICFEIDCALGRV